MRKVYTKANSEDSGKPAHLRSVAKAFAVRLHNEDSGKPAHLRSVAKAFAVRLHNIGN